MDPIEVHAYVDGELPAGQLAEVKASIDSSPETIREVEAIRGLKTMLRERIETPEIGSSWKSCVKRLDEIDKAQKVERAVNRWAPAICSVLFLGIIGAGLMTRYTHWKPSADSPSVARFLGFSANPTQSIDHQERMLKQSFSSTPVHMQVRGVSDYVIDGTPVRRFDVRDASGNLQILLVHEHIDFEGMRTLPDHLSVRVGIVGTTNCAARIDGNDTIVVIANRSYKDLAEVLNQVHLN